LEVFKDAIMLLEYRDQPTISWLFGTFKMLLDFVGNFGARNVGVRKLCIRLKEELTTRFAYVLEDERFLVATYIDPATAHHLMDEERDKAQEALVQWMGQMENDFESEENSQQMSFSIGGNRLEQLLNSRNHAAFETSNEGNLSTVIAYAAEVKSHFYSVGPPEQGVRSQVSRPFLIPYYYYFREVSMLSMPFALQIRAIPKFIRSLENCWLSNLPVLQLKACSQSPVFVREVTSQILRRNS